MYSPGCKTLGNLYQLHTSWLWLARSPKTSKWAKGVGYSRFTNFSPVSEKYFFYTNILCRSHRLTFLFPFSHTFFQHYEVKSLAEQCDSPLVGLEQQLPSKCNAQKPHGWVVKGWLKANRQQRKRLPTRSVSIAHTWKWICTVSVVVKTIQAQLLFPAVACLSPSSLCTYAVTYCLRASFTHTFPGTVNGFSGYVTSFSKNKTCFRESKH